MQNKLINSKSNVNFKVTSFEDNNPAKNQSKAASQIHHSSQKELGAPKSRELRDFKDMPGGPQLFQIISKQKSYDHFSSPFDPFSQNLNSIERDERGERSVAHMTPITFVDDSAGPPSK